MNQLVTDLVVMISLLAMACVAQAGEWPICTPVRVATPPQIDGRLTEACWSQAPVLTNFAVLDSRQPAQPPTEVRVVFDERALYVGVRCLEPHPELLVAAHQQRDSEVYADDAVEVFFDPGRIPGHRYQFIVNVANVQFDSLDGDPAWDAQWQSATAVGEGEWTLELAIPWSVFGLDGPGQDLWSANFCRDRVAAGEPVPWEQMQCSSWSPVKSSFHDTSQFGYLALPNLSELLKAQVTKAREQYQLAAQQVEAIAAVTAVGAQQLRDKLDQAQVALARAEEVARQKQPAVEEIIAAYVQTEATLEEIGDVRQGAKFYQARPGQGDWEYVLAVASSMTKVHREVGRNSPALLTEAASEPLQLDGARGEYVHGQVVIVPVKQDLTGLTWSAEPLRGPEGATLPLSIRVVGYLKTEKPVYRVDFVGWWPDPLLSHLTTFDVPVGFCQPLWVTVAVPREAPPGVYEGQVRVNVGGDEQAVPVRLRVRSFAIPKTHHFRVANCYTESVGPELYGEAWNDKLKWRFRQFILNHRLNVGGIYHWGLDMGKEPVEDLKRLWAGGQNFFTIVYVGDEEIVVTPEWCEKVDAILKRAHEAGIPDEALWFYGFDEAGEERRQEMIAASKEIKERYPQIGIMTTAGFNQDMGARDELAQTIDAWVPLTPEYMKYRGTIAATRARGKEVWWYICCGPQHPYANFLIEYPAIEARLLMGMMAWKYQSDGFLHWALNFSPKNDKVIDDGPLCQWDPVTWPGYNGDGCVFYYGIDGPVSTIRLENITDGLEDYEYFWVLRDLTDKLRHNDALRHTREGTLALRAARRCLTVPPSTVETLTSFTQDPAEVERVRSAVADAIEGLLSLGLEQG